MGFRGTAIQSTGRRERAKGATECRLEEEGILSSYRSASTCPTTHEPSLTAPRGYTYPATYKVCTVSARGGLPNPHTGLHVLAPHRCRAAPDWRGFLTAIGFRSFPIGRPFNQTPPVGRTGLDTRPSRQRWGTGTRRADASRHYGRRRRSSPPWQEGNHAPQCGRVHLSCRARSVTTRRFAGVPPDLQARV